MRPRPSKVSLSVSYQVMLILMTLCYIIKVAASVLPINGIHRNTPKGFHRLLELWNTDNYTSANSVMKKIVK